MKNYIQEKTRYLKALMLILVVGLFAFNGFAQTFTAITAPDDALDHYATRDSLVSFDATPVLTGGTVYLYYGAAFDEANVLGTSNVAAGQTITFTWPDQGSYQLKLVEATGSFNTVTEQIPTNQLTTIGTTQTNYNFTFSQAGGRSVTTTSNDLSGQTVRLNVNINTTPLSLNDSLLVQYATNGTAFTTLTELSAETKLGSDGNYSFDLPAAAISATTSFRIIQENSGAINTGVDAWRLDNLELEFGEALNYDFANQVVVGNYNVNLSNISVIDVLDDQDISIGGAGLYPRDTVTLVSTFNGFEVADYNYVAFIEANIGSQTTVYELDEQVLDVSTPGEIRITGSIPLNVLYNEDWSFNIKAYDATESAAIIGQSFDISENIISGGGPTFTMSAGNSTVETGTFLDPGGFGNYFNNANVTQTFYPNDPAAKLRFDFISFNVENGFDNLYIYDGTSTAAPLIGVFTNGVNPASVVQATNSSGALTFRFTSDGSVTPSGWEANISSVIFATLIGGDFIGGSFEFSKDGARSYTSHSFSVNSDDGVITFDLRRDNNTISPAGTEIAVEYSTDGSTFTELGQISLNELTTSYETFELTDWPAGVASATTQFRFRQLSNNGENLNAWSLRDMMIDVNTNLINGGVFDYLSYGPNQINEPIINLAVYDILANGQVFPGSEITLIYEILDGAFASGTEIDGIFDRNDALGYEYSIGSSTSLGGPINVMIPAVAAGTYPVYLETSNGVSSNSLSLQVSGLSLQVDSIKGTPSVLFQGNEVYYPGSDVQVFYTLTGTPGTGANLLFNVEDNISGEFVTIGTASTFGGSITASLPDSIDYTGNYQLAVSTGQPLVTGGSSTIINENYGGSFANAADAESWTTLQGYEFGNSFLGTGVRSAVTEPIEILNGARIQINVGEDGNFSGSFEVILQASTDGTNWEDLETAAISVDGGSYFFNLLLPTTVWSETTQFRIISNEDEAFAYNENAFDLTSFSLQIPNTQELALATGTLDIVFPTLAVEDLEVNWTVGADISIDFNLTGPFPANTFIAAIVENAGTGDFELIGEVAATEVGVISGTLPVMNETQAGDPYNQIKLVPYIKSDASVNYEQGANVQIELEEDFLMIEGDDNPSFAPANFSFNEIGNRSILTKDYDLSAPSTASIQFTFTDVDGTFDMNGNQNVVPRLQVSIDAGASFQEIPINEMNEQVGLLYESQTYTVEVPDEYLTAATHFRWVQPLNLGYDKNTWSVSNINIVLGEINALQTSYNTLNDVQGINLNNPSLNGYSWSQTDLNDAVFNGEAFDYSWNVAEGFAPEDVDAFPAGTEFIFYLEENGNYVMNPETDLPYVLGSITSLGTFEAEVPFFVVNGNYNVMLAASIVIEGLNGPEDYYFYGDEETGINVGNLDVFLRAARLTYLGDPNATIYAGQDVEFEITIENNETNTAATADLYANVILTVNGDRIVMATQQGLGNVSFALPTDVSGTRNFSLMLTENAPIAEVGSILENQQYDDLEDDSDNFITVDNSSFSNTSGRRLITTRDFMPAEIEDATLFEFDATFNQLPSNLTASQYVIFEYSTDAGATYASLDTLPATDATQTLSNEGFMYAFSTDMKTNGVRFRLRQEEAKGSFSINDFDFIFGETLPFDYIDETVAIVRQALLVTDITPSEVCQGDDITLSYEIRGRFGADNVVTIDYRNSAGSINPLSDISFEANLLEGTGDITFSLPGDVLAAGADNDTFKFRLYADDQTTNNNFTVTGPFSEERVELVAPIDLATDFTVDNQPKTCETKDVIISITSPLDYFTYQLVNAVTGANIGGALTYDSELGDNQINIGVVSEDVRLGLIVTSASSAGTTCASVTSSVEREVTVQPDYSLFNNGSPVATGTSINVCGNSVSLTASYYNTIGAQQDALNVEWFRGDVNTPVSINTTLAIFSRTGDYFARVTDGNCVYTTESINIVVPVTPEQPTITSTGDLVSCDEDNVVTLSGPEGFATYSWTRNTVVISSNQRTITVSANGTYQLQVSNAAQANDCNLSNTSNPVIVNTVDDDDVFVDISGFGAAQAGQVYDICSDNNTNITVSGAVVGNNNIKFFKDGAEYSAATTTGGAVSITESGVYYAEVTAGNCVFTTPEVTFNVLEAPATAPVITTADELTFCDGQGSVTLVGPEGFGFYQWDGIASSGATTSSNTIEVSQAGTYTLQVGNVSADGAVSCLSPASNTITVNTRTLPQMPRATVFNRACGEGQATFVLDAVFISGSGMQDVQNNVSYQLIDAGTGAPSGNPVTGNGNGNTYITSDVISKQTTFYIEASYADGSGCAVSYPETRSFSATPNNVTLEVQGSQLIASYNNSGASEVRWYRNGVLLFNSTGNSITITDNAEYSVEVEYASGCVVTSNTAEIGKVLANRSGVSMEVNTYPNPTTSDVNLNIVSEYMGKHQVVITTMTGQVMKSDSFEKNNIEAKHLISISDLQSGIYLLQVQYEGLVKNVRIIKN